MVFTTHREMIHLRRGVESWLRGSSKSIPRSVKFFRRWVLMKNARSRPLHGIPTRSRGITGHLDIGYRWTARPEASTWWRWEIGRYILLYDDRWKKVQRSVEYLCTKAFLLTRPQKMWRPNETTSDHDYHNFFTDVSRWLVFVGRRSKTKQLWLVRS